ncbi:cytochrome c maturation protein CcmE [Agrobacterium sp.]|uniref:cytochrome c maturation protein CcmE n=1 Tax=Agrobacterium sp. TaxID=361 RepID=UPI0028A97644|nr:cytochrome c maturation protein CcmE [Agrobacterium sp.]
MTRKQKRLSIIGGGVSFIIAAVFLVMFAFGQAVAYFYMPSDLTKTTVEPGTRIRLGGENSVKRGEGTTVSFVVTDGSATVPVSYTGILPDLFREGQGVVTEGVFDATTHTFMADSVLAKHDENYMPKEVADRLKEQGLWQHGGEEAAAGATQ